MYRLQSIGKPNQIRDLFALFVKKEGGAQYNCNMLQYNQVNSQSNLK